MRLREYLTENSGDNWHFAKKWGKMVDVYTEHLTVNKMTLKQYIAAVAKVTGLKVGSDLELEQGSVDIGVDLAGANRFQVFIFKDTYNKLDKKGKIEAIEDIW